MQIEIETLFSLGFCMFAIVWHCGSQGEGVSVESYRKALIEAFDHRNAKLEDWIQPTDCVRYLCHPLERIAIFHSWLQMDLL